MFGRPPESYRRREFLRRGTVAIVAGAAGLSAIGGSDPLPFPAAPSAGRVNFVAPFAIDARAAPVVQWVCRSGARVSAAGALQLPPGATATSPRVDVAPDTGYEFACRGTAAFRCEFLWEDFARHPLLQQVVGGATGALAIPLAVPRGASGLRVRLVAAGPGGEVTDPRLSLVTGVRLEPFPDFARAAFAFSFDWESAMGGLIHSRSAGDPEAEAGGISGVAADGGPAPEEATAKGLLMRQGAAFLMEHFARYDIRATFYATGYNLLDGNPGALQFLHEPLYPNSDRAHGWASDYWRTHPWYRHDPCTTEADDPAWYFASQTRALAAVGHEIASHTFGHLYVRGVQPAQLEADLEQWSRAAQALGVPVAPSFAFPWTSSNSLDGRFYDIFARRGLTILTRTYQTAEQPLSHPFELAPVDGDPRLLVFPDHYLPSQRAHLAEALGGIEAALARRGYFSLWTHPHEILEQDGVAVWEAAIEAAAAARGRGLWVAPVTHIARYAQALRQMQVTTQALSGGVQALVAHHGAATLPYGPIVTLPFVPRQVSVDGRAWADTRVDQVRLAPLAPGATVTVRAWR